MMKIPKSILAGERMNYRRIHLHLWEQKWYAVERSAYYFASLFNPAHPGNESNISVVAACKRVGCNYRTYYRLKYEKLTGDQLLKYRKTNKESNQ